MPKNRTRPRIITSSPTMSLPCVTWLIPRLSFKRIGTQCAAPPPTSRLLGLLLPQVAIVDVTDRDRPSGQRAAERAGEFQGRAGLQRGIDRFQVGGAGIG